MERISQKNIYEVADIERAVKGKQYPKGTVLVKLSFSDDQVDILYSPSEVSNRFACIIPKTLTDDDFSYLGRSVSSVYSEFFQRANTGRNMRFKSLKFLQIPWHNDPKKRKAIHNALKAIDEQIGKEQRRISTMHALRDACLGKLFP